MTATVPFSAYVRPVWPARPPCPPVVPIHRVGGFSDAARLRQIRAALVSDFTTVFRELMPPEETGHLRASRGSLCTAWQRFSPTDLAALSRAKAVLVKAEIESGFFIEDILGPSRNKEIVQVRHKAMCAVSDVCPDKSLPWIARFFGRDHTTVLHALRKFGRWPRGRQ